MWKILLPWLLTLTMGSGTSEVSWMSPVSFVRVQLIRSKAVLGVG